MLEKLKDHPLYAVLGAIALFVLVYVFSRGSGGGGGGVQVVSSGPSDAVQQASIAASAQQAQTQAQVNVAGQKLQAQYNLGVLDYQSKQLEDHLAADTAVSQISGQVDIAGLAAQTQQFVTRENNATQVSIADKSYDTAALINNDNQTTQRLQITSSAAMFKEQVDGETHNADTNAALQTSLARTAADVILGESSNAKDVSLANINAGRDVNLANIYSNRDVDLASIDSTNKSNALKYDYAGKVVDANTFIAGKTIDATVTLGLGEQANEHDYIDWSGRLTEDSMEHTAALKNSTLTLVGNGTFNKGGEGGANQVAVVQSVFGTGSPNPYQNAPGQSLRGIFAGFANISKIVGAGLVG